MTGKKDTPMNVPLSGNIDDDVRDVVALLGRLNEIHSTDSDRKWQIRCGDCHYLGPWSAAILYAAYLKGMELNQNPKIKLPTKPDALRAYCVFAGMSQAFSNGPAPDPDHPKCETIPLLRFTAASWNLADGIIRLLNDIPISDKSRRIK
jgi:hypothetical protein